MWDMPFGIGIHQESNENIYEGMWSYGSKHGDGNYTNSSTGAVITGVWNSETEICHGIEKNKNKDVYTGEFFQEQRHGEGMLTTIDGSEYIG